MSHPVSLALAVRRGASLIVTLVLLSTPGPARAEEGEEASLLGELGLARPPAPPDAPHAGRTPDEPGPSARREAGPGGWGPWFEGQLAFGFASLMEDPDLDPGYGGGVFLTLGFHRRVGLEAAIFFSRFAYAEELGAIGSTFIAGNVTSGGVVRLLQPEGRLQLNLEAGLGGYLVYVAPGLWDGQWTLGAYGGASFAVRLTSWIGLGIKLRYHLFNLAGGEMRDIKSFREVGVLDRLEMPVFVAFYL